ELGLATRHLAELVQAKDRPDVPRQHPFDRFHQVAERSYRLAQSKSVRDFLQPARQSVTTRILEIDVCHASRGHPLDAMPLDVQQDGRFSNSSLTDELAALTPHQVIPQRTAFLLPIEKERVVPNSPSDAEWVQASCRSGCRRPLVVRD